MKSKSELRRMEIMNAAECANFIQKFKTLIWEKQESVMPGIPCIPEPFLDSIAIELFNYIKTK